MRRASVRLLRLDLGRPRYRPRRNPERDNLLWRKRGSGDEHGRGRHAERGSVVALSDFETFGAVP